MNLIFAFLITLAGVPSAMAFVNSGHVEENYVRYQVLATNSFNVTFSYEYEDDCNDPSASLDLQEVSPLYESQEQRSTVPQGMLVRKVVVGTRMGCSGKYPMKTYSKTMTVEVLKENLIEGSPMKFQFWVEPAIKVTIESLK